MLYDPRWEVVTKPLEQWRYTLLAAANVVRERGLTQFTQQNTLGQVCLHGALSIAATGKTNCELSEPTYCEAAKAVCDHLRSLGVTYIGERGAAQWNNQEGRTAQEVIAVLEAAAAA